MNSRGLDWLVGDEVIELRQLKERFYTPGLLARLLGYSKEPLPPVTKLDSVELSPTAALEPPPIGSSQARLRLVNRGGGIGNVTVKVNGRAIPLDAKHSPIDPDATVADIQLDLSEA